MQPNTVGRWLLVTLAILGLALAVPAVSAHGGDPVAANETVDAEPPVDDRADGLAWMDTHMRTAGDDAWGWHMGPPTEEMATQMGLTAEEMPRNAGEHHRVQAEDHRGIVDERDDNRTRSHRGGC